MERLHSLLEEKMKIIAERQESESAVFSRNQSGIYVIERSCSIGSADAEHDAVLERIQSNRSDEADTMSISSNSSASAETSIIEERLRGKLTSIKNIIKNKVTRRVSDTNLQSTGNPAAVHRSFSEVIAPQSDAIVAEVLERVDSAESLRSIEKGSDEDPSSNKLSRRGSFTSNDYSISSNEIISGSLPPGNFVFCISIEGAYLFGPRS
jgi:hypothetical protein